MKSIGKKKKKNKDDMVNTTFRLPKKDLKRLKKASEKHKILYPTPSHLIRVAVDKFLNELESMNWFEKNKEYRAGKK